MNDHHTSPRITVVIPADQRRDLEAMANTYDATISQLVRRALDEYLGKYR